MVEELGGEVGASFVMSGARDGFEGDAAFVGESADDGAADSLFGVRGGADFLRGPMDVDFVSG